ncbi:uncharacterized protein LOC108743754 isoform X2 [Agrilus planipennis]|uniref:Uncharacterized protein LOC108743754 isoform X2 n=1 Tax=Agrilus planipennis TaxID=224129 RepID=A0A1W4XQT2_AGRPL|nr:uncharacterized protein LOC108743754 isoform X2 [Agrilus planipennis]
MIAFAFPNPKLPKDVATQRADYMSNQMDPEKPTESQLHAEDAALAVQPLSVAPMMYPNHVMHMMYLNQMANQLASSNNNNATNIPTSSPFMLSMPPNQMLVMHPMFAMQPTYPQNVTVVDDKAKPVEHTHVNK